jgi:hypothetical protein
MNVADMEKYLELKRKIIEASSVVGDLTIFHAAMGRFPTREETQHRLRWARDRLRQLVAELDLLLL